MPKLTEAQLAERATGLGATDVVEALGLSPWAGSGPMRLFLEKTGQAPAEETDPEKLKWLNWGLDLEPVMAAWYERETGERLLPGGHVPHREHEWLWATLDYKAEARTVELKNVGSVFAHHWDATAEGGVPRYVRVQCLVQQACLGVRLTDVVASIGGRPPVIFTIAWDEELAELILKGAADFWARVQRGEAPPLDATDASLAWIKRKWPTNEDRIILEATPEAEDIAARRIMASVEEEDAKVKKRLADLDLLEKIGPHDGIRGDGWSMTHRVDKNGVRRQRFTAKGTR